MKQGLPWYKRDAVDYLGGVQGLNSKEHAVYSVVLDLIYVHGGSVNNDPRWISGWISDMGAAAVRNTINSLVAKGKLYIDGDQLSQKRARNEVKTKEKQRENASKNGRLGGVSSGKSRSELNENNDINKADASEKSAQDKIREDKIETPPDSHTSTYGKGERDGPGGGYDLDVGQKPKSRPKAEDRAWLDTWPRLVAAYNDLCVETGWTPLDHLQGSVGQRRAAMARGRLKEADGDEAVLFDVLRRAARSTYLTGGSRSGWRADFDWMMKPDNFVKILEGGFDDREVQRPDGEGRRGHNRMLAAFAAEGGQRRSDGPDQGSDGDEEPGGQRLLRGNASG